MTSVDLFAKLEPNKTKTFEGYYREHFGLDINYSDIFCKLIKNAARVNRFQSDVYYILKEIDEALRDYNPENPPEPIWAATRKDGVDGTAFLATVCESPEMYGTIGQRYLNIFSVSFRQEETEYGRRYYVDFNEYWI